MSSSCLKLLLALTLFVIITECRPQGPGGRPRRAKKTCKDGGECSLGFSCLQTPTGKKRCAKGKSDAVIPECRDDADCSPRFSCVQTPKGKKCAKPAAPAVKSNLIKSKATSKYKNTEYNRV